MTPFAHGLIRVDFDKCGVRSCVRPFDAVILIAGPDEVRVPGPNQTIELLCPDSTSGCPDSGSYNRAVPPRTNAP
jgi:hypothetical protein